MDLITSVKVDFKAPKATKVDQASEPTIGEENIKSVERDIGNFDKDLITSVKVDYKAPKATKVDQASEPTIGKENIKSVERDIGNFDKDLITSVKVDYKAPKATKVDQASEPTIGKENIKFVERDIGNFDKESKSVLKVDNKPPETTIVKVDLASEKGNINSLEAKIGNLDKDYNVGLNDVTLDLRNAIAAVIEGIREPEDKADQAAPLGKAEKADVGIMKDIPNALLLQLKNDINDVIEILEVEGIKESAEYVRKWLSANMCTEDERIIHSVLGVGARSLSGFSYMKDFRLKILVSMILMIAKIAVMFGGNVEQVLHLSKLEIAELGNCDISIASAKSPSKPMYYQGQVQVASRDASAPVSPSTARDALDQSSRNQVQQVQDSGYGMPLQSDQKQQNQLQQSDISDQSHVMKQSS